MPACGAPTGLEDLRLRVRGGHADDVGSRQHDWAADESTPHDELTIAYLDGTCSHGGQGDRQGPQRTQGLSMGSVRVILKTPELRAPGDEFPDTDTDQLDDQALRRLVALFMQADADENSPEDQQTLDAAMHGLRGETRNAVRLMSQSVIDARWEVEGEFRPRHGTPTAVSITPRAAARLVTAAKVERSEVATEVVEGRVDGWIWSEQVLAFEPVEGRRIRAVVPADLQARVAELGGAESRPLCSARFTVVTTYAPGQTASRHRSFALEAIEAVGDPQGFDDLD